MARALIHQLEKENRERGGKKGRKDRHALLVRVGTPCLSFSFSPLSFSFSPLSFSFSRAR